ncbi:MAG: hypothetical protein D6748_03540 [Calditrichaeota bacterium]|nr:MAG: hypothetical protein D6748_03540 [Calditrichota bacterium]
MGIIEKLKESLKQGSEKVQQVSDKLVEKGKKVGGEGLEVTKEVVNQLEEKTSDITAIARLKLDIALLSKNLKKEYAMLGQMLYQSLEAGKSIIEDSTLQGQFNRLTSLEQEYQSKLAELEKYEKQHSHDYTGKKFLEELDAAQALIEEVQISEKSNVVGKRLKEIVLPRQALISVLKRGDELLIPDGNTKLLAGDKVVIIGKRNDVEKISKRFTAKNKN